MLAHAAPTLSQCDRRFPSFYVSLSHYLSVFEETKTVLFLKKKRWKVLAWGPKCHQPLWNAGRLRLFLGYNFSKASTFRPRGEQSLDPELRETTWKRKGRLCGFKFVVFDGRAKEMMVSVWAVTVINSDCSQKGTVSHKRRVWETVSVWL